ncbi:ABC transporter ATP-binding protein [Treponema phagedenis]|uniref:ABC transporter ATP-binding protein n=1 Tax=Treponema phagedenis TaxID=162 RepID=A0A0B7GWI6_TREPH|nr:ABC transporter ATP-binding protein [Treponema phagedenis]QEJ95672.1 ABC transporter ATP-binding protein [Treponema phagedenis]QEJ97210.1 ABC transporter ATP-binding protein [Treponema phagedenis]QEK02598.1 ABC transporter ATP-binding protein [Treponema phagedenis]QEK08226.1 ABC transporter ATP-binding protein [Treponema phagedenis]CEM62888.1 ABC transporter, ATP-binding/permease protein [Treponema phagedenis]
MNLIKRYVQKNKGKYIASIFFAVVGVIMDLAAYIILSKIIAALITGSTDAGFYGKNILYILLILVLKEIFAGTSTTISHTATFKSLKEIRKEIARKLFKMPLGDILNQSSGKLKNIIVDQVDHMETTLAHVIPEATANIVGPAILLIYMFILDWRLALLSLIPLIIGMLAIMSVMNESYKKNYKESVELGQNMNNAIVEYVGGVEVIKTFNQSETSYKKYSDAVYDNARFYYNWMKGCMMQVSIGRFISPMGLLTILPFGVFFYIRGTIALTALIQLIILSFGTVSGILKVMNFMDDLARVGTITGEIESILNARELSHSEESVSINNHTIEFTDVNFSYEKDKKVIDNLNLKINEGDVTAFVGPSGGGKSTIAKLIAGFWDTDAGEITIGGANLKEIPLSQLSDLISYVSQDNFLFDMSVLENIRIGNPNASDSEVKEIAKKSGCEKFILELENGYDTLVGEGGGHLSGGERQRISIARAMLKNAPIVILDEATSYIDPENESIMQEAIGNLVQNKTLIIIAHRLRTITDADKIFVIQGGHIESSGTHQELLEKSSLYSDMWNAAIKGDE